ncbi:sialic acid-binding Ig-like lectin 8 isoform X1 [Panthera tigris]|uniref:sialic acid-binding Ig-like lectin 8 isoform X1 n=1 Tax=Panthera tigris TaxID=9694 RepID=UPI001C6F8CEF|nr:sialic acid-binding Ig-like lectin 8 isoform X1 [Panthera tigris]
MLLLLLALLWGREGAEGQRGAGRGPQGDYWLQVQDAKGQEGLCVRVSCRCFYPWEGWSESTPALGYWFRKGAGVQQDVLVATNNPDGKVQQESQGRFRLLGNPQDYDCSLDIRDVRRGDSGTYVFRVERGPSVRYTYTRDQLSVRVTALTQTPDILISGTLESGCPSNLTCSVPWACEWGTPPIFSWTSAALTSLGPKTHLSSVLTLTPRLQNHGTELTCQVTLPGTGVTTMRTIHLNVSSPVGTEGQCPPALSVAANLPCLSVPDSPWNLTVAVFQENGTGRIGAPPRVQGARAGPGPSCGSPRGPPPPRPPWPCEQLSPPPCYQESKNRATLARQNCPLSCTSGRPHLLFSYQPFI